MLASGRGPIARGMAAAPGPTITVTDTVHAEHMAPLHLPRRPTLVPGIQTRSTSAFGAASSSHAFTVIANML
jgi:hypothetical protein